MKWNKSLIFGMLPDKKTHTFILVLFIEKRNIEQVALNLSMNRFYVIIYFSNYVKVSIYKTSKVINLLDDFFVLAKKTIWLHFLLSANKPSNTKELFTSFLESATF